MEVLRCDCCGAIMNYSDAMNIKAFKYNYHRVDDCHTIKRDLCRKCYKELLDNITLKKED